MRVREARTRHHGWCDRRVKSKWNLSFASTSVSGITSVRPIVFDGLIGGTCTVWLRLWPPVGKDLQVCVVILGGGDLLEERFVGFG
jgi:hypothetical protein